MLPHRSVPLAACILSVALGQAIPLPVHAAPVPVSGRKVSWWWDGRSKDDASDLLNFVKEHKGVVSSVFMNCGPHLTNDGTFAGDLSAGCTSAIPQLEKLGVVPELWLGESDNLTAHHLLFDRSDEAADTLVKLGTGSGFKGMNIDLEPAGDLRSTAADAVLYASFLKKLRPRLNAAGMRLTVDVASTGWCPMIGNMSLLADSVDKVIDMSTYNAGSYSQWLGWYAPMAASAPHEKVGVGLGCWVNSKTNGTWAVTSESAKQRICRIMNDSFAEVDMFRILPQLGWPENFWMSELEKFMAGGGCVPVPPPPDSCPKGFHGPNSKHCCIAYYSSDCPMACQKQRCEDYKDWQWQDLDFHHNPYTCCPQSDRPDMVV